MTRGEIKRWWFDLFGAKFKNSTIYGAVEAKLEQICSAHETEIRGLKSTIDMFVEEAAMYSNALDRNKEEYEAKLKVKDERIAELEAMIEKMKCCENCSFYPPQKCRFDTQYGCLDGLIPTNWKIKGTNNE